MTVKLQHSSSFPNFSVAGERELFSGLTKLGNPGGCGFWWDDLDTVDGSFTVQRSIATLWSRDRTEKLKKNKQTLFRKHFITNCIQDGAELRG